jgi:hypothetical protein
MYTLHVTRIECMQYSVAVRRNLETGGCPQAELVYGYKLSERSHEGRGGGDHGKTAHVCSGG